MQYCKLAMLIQLCIKSPTQTTVLDVGNFFAPCCPHIMMTSYKKIENHWQLCVNVFMMSVASIYHIVRHQNLLCHCCYSTMLINVNRTKSTFLDLKEPDMAQGISLQLQLCSKKTDSLHDARYILTMI